MAKVIQWRHGSSTENKSFVGDDREITIDDTVHSIRVHDGTTAGGHLLARLSDLPTKLSQFTDDIGVWRADTLTKLSQLTNDSGFWSKSSLTKVSQLTNDSKFLTAHCSYCSYCTYCSQCSNCYNCTTVQCTTVQCTTVNCTTVQCTYVECSYKWCNDCSGADDS
jgi:hypothetical protein